MQKKDANNLTKYITEGFITKYITITKYIEF